MPSVALSPAGDHTVVSGLPANLMDIGTVVGVGSGVPAAAEFFDYFFSDNAGAPADNLNAFLQWSVTGGSVDLVGGFGPGVFGAPPNEPAGRYVDLGGSTADPGFFETRLAYPVVAGQTYTFAFDFRSTGGDLNRASASVGGLTFNVSTASTQFQHFSATFVAGATATVKVAFQGDEADLDGSGVGVDGVLFGPAQPGATVGVIGGVPAGVAGSGGGGSGGGGTQPANTSAQYGFTTQFQNLERAGAGDPGYVSSASPLSVALQAEQAIAARLDAGQLSLADAQAALYHLVDGTTSVAEISYAFFTGRTPTAAGLNYLVNSSANPNDLNDAYYQRFSTENRYINFAVNLATGGGAGAAAFQENYGSLSLQDATAKAYQAVFGVQATTDKVAAILSALVPNGLGGTETRAQYFADVSGGSPAAQKAAVIGFLLADSVKEGFGLYQQADLHFLQDLAHGTAIHNVDLLAAYGPAPTLVGPPVADPTIGG